MKNQLILRSSLFIGLILATSCQKNDDEMNDLGCDRCGDREQIDITSPVCDLDDTYFIDTVMAPPSLEVTCQAYFESWFIERASNTCVKAGYSGCEPEGFATEAECQECKPCRLDECDFLGTYCPEPFQFTCDAIWETWLIDRENNECVLVNYSGCEPPGFATEAECDKCKSAVLN
jgi:hypothetical protein